MTEYQASTMNHISVMNSTRVFRPITKKTAAKGSVERIPTSMRKRLLNGTQANKSITVLPWATRIEVRLDQE